jgi:hypothetical protein
VGDDLQVSGGAGGVTASYEDMLSYATMLDDAGDDLLSKSGDLARLLVDGSILQAAVLCPTEVAGVEASIADAATGTSGALWTGGELEVTARFLRTSVTVMQQTDELLAQAEEIAWTAGGWVAGAVAPLGALGALGLAASNPLLAALLYAHRDELLSELQESLYDNPWLLEALTRMAPGMIQGGAFSLAGLLPGGPLALMMLTDGNWPTGDYATAIAGLLALANRGGLLADTGEFAVDEVEGSQRPLTITPDNALQTIFDEQGRLGAQGSEGQVQIVRIDHGDGPPSWIVQIPGTQVWDPRRGDNPVDLTSNVTMMSMPDQTVIEAQVSAAMRKAGIEPGQDVMLTGHSQGGITAASMASDPDVLAEFDIRSVVTGGSPIGRFDIPDDISVMSLEHVQDVVPKLDGADNPDRPNWTTVTRELTDAEGTLDGQRGPGGAHSTDTYAGTGADVDASDDPGIEQWRQDQQQFLDGTGTRTRYQISAAGP